jgi:hypothetical protein
MSRPFVFAFLALTAAGCIDLAEAQPRRRPPRRRPAVTRPTTPRAPAAPTDVRYVVEPRAGEWEARCVAARGCPAPRALTRCPQPAPNVRLMQRRALTEVVEQRAALTGQRVSVRGTLHAFLGCTELACPRDACCNHCFSALRLTGSDANGAYVQVGLERDAVFGCEGDDSGMCCGTEVPAGEVLVTGVLRAVPGGGTLRLDSPDVCAL